MPFVISSSGFLSYFPLVNSDSRLLCSKVHDLSTESFPFPKGQDAVFMFVLSTFTVCFYCLLSRKVIYCRPLYYVSFLFLRVKYCFNLTLAFVKESFCFCPVGLSFH
ncbi:hypothetical protein Scep_020877 [Stephania cephalantha]|uniref:Uncharacterized protein n=1 Tax=Stephania cephalantha TaxID=152367 RepID=A0AAP0F9P7_9MAGN